MKTVNNTKTFDFSDEDISLLAVMSERCLPLVVRGFILRHSYSYYILTDDSNIDIAYDIFAKNGLEMEYYPYKNMPEDDLHKLLRIRHNKQNAQSIIDIMQVIRMRKNTIAQDHSAWWKAQYKVSELFAERKKNIQR